MTRAHSKQVCLSRYLGPDHVYDLSLLETESELENFSTKIKNYYFQSPNTLAICT